MKTPERPLPATLEPAANTLPTRNTMFQLGQFNRVIARHKKKRGAGVKPRPRNRLCSWQLPSQPITSTHDACPHVLPLDLQALLEHATRPAFRQAPTTLHLIITSFTVIDGDKTLPLFSCQRYDRIYPLSLPFQTRRGRKVEQHLPRPRPRITPDHHVPG